MKIYYSAWSGSAKMLGKLSAPVRPTDLDNSRIRACCAGSRCGWGCLDYFFSRLSLFFLPLWETARCRLKYCLKGPVGSNIKSRKSKGSWHLQKKKKKKDQNRLNDFGLTVIQFSTQFRTGYTSESFDLYELIWLHF